MSIKRLYFTDPLNGVLKQNLMKHVYFNRFSVKFLKDVWYIFISNNITIHLINCHSSPLKTTGYLLKYLHISTFYHTIWVRACLLVANVNYICLFCCFTSQVNSYGHYGTVSSPNHTFSWAGLNKQLTSISAHTFACN